MAELLQSVSMEDLSLPVGNLTPPHSPDDDDDDGIAKPKPKESELLRIAQYHNQRSHSDSLLLDKQRNNEVVVELELPSTPSTSTLVEEIEDKYFSEVDAAEEIIIFGQPPVSPCKHLPGKRGASGNLELLVLNGRNIGRIGDLADFGRLALHVTELDLAQNVLSNWREVGHIISNIPNLRHCNMSHNPLHEPIPKSWTPPTANKLNSLVLNGTDVRWDALFTLLDHMPHLEELHLSLNDYSTPDDLPAATDEHSYSTVHILHTNGCNLKDWHSLLRISRLFPCVESVVAAENGFESTEVATDLPMQDIFGCLLSLNVNKTGLRDWDSVDRLRRLPLLCELRVNQIPLLEPYSDEERRHLVVARLPDVTTLNGSQVSADNRLESERFFIRHFMQKDDKPQRYHELVAIHGQLEQLVDIDLRPKLTAKVTLVCEELSLRGEKEIILNQSVGHFKKQLEQFCGIAPARMRIFYYDKDLIGSYADELRLPKLMLHSLQVQDGDEFRIQTKLEARIRRRTSSGRDSKLPCK